VVLEAVGNAYFVHPAAYVVRDLADSGEIYEQTDLQLLTIALRVPAELFRVSQIHVPHR